MSLRMVWLRRIAVLGALCFALLLSFARGALAADAPADPIHQAERSVVRVVTVSFDELDNPVALETGSGFVVAPGKVVTNRHVVQGAALASKVEIFVIPDLDAGGASLKVSVSQTWTDGDLALLDAPSLGSPPIPVASVAPGKDATVHALGYPGVTDEVRNLPLSEILKPQDVYVTPGSIVLEVVDVDGFAGGRFELDASPDGARCRATTRSAQVRLPAASLGSLYLGGVPLALLAAAGRADLLDSSALAIADSLFHWPVAPFCATWF